jgi:hypothetical protein
MTSWRSFTAAAPELADRVGGLFRAHKHHAMATLRRDGAPRISGTEVQFEDGELLVAMMAGTRRAADLRRDARVAIHSQGVDPPDRDQQAWPGEAKVAGRAVELAAGADGADRFRIDITEVVLTRLGTPADHLLIESWRPDRGLVTLRR